MPTEEILEETADLATPDETAETLTPGAVLQAERLRRELSEKQVADKLHITMHYVRAIEANKFEKLPGAVFAKGYIKSYALLLELDAAEVTALFDGINSKEQVKKEEANRREMAKRRSDRNKPWVYASVACFVLGFAGLWAYNQYAGEEVSSPQPAATNTAPPSTIASRPIAQTPVRPDPEPVISTASLRPAPTAASAIVAPVEPPPATGQTDTRNLPAVLSSLAAQSAADDNFTAIVDSIEPTATIAATATQEVQKTAGQDHIISVDADGDDVLRIRFSGESWVEVNDRNSRQIYRDIREAGDILEISGAAPFSILLGDAPFTRMSLNGTEIDVSDNIRIDNSARLTVGL